MPRKKPWEDLGKRQKNHRLQQIAQSRAEELAGLFAEALLDQKRKEVGRSRHTTDEQLRNRQLCNFVMFADFGDENEQSAAATSGSAAAEGDNFTAENSAATPVDGETPSTSTGNSTEANNPPAEGSTTTGFETTSCSADAPVESDDPLDGLFNLFNENSSCDSQNECDFLDFRRDCADFKAKVRNYLISSHLTLEQGSNLLKLLRECGHGELPCDARTLLGTPRANTNVIVDKDKKCSYAYLGLKKGIIDKLLFESVVPSAIKLRFNVDGLPIGDNNHQFWPILCSISNIEDSCPFIVALYEGLEKPDMNELLSELVDELIDLNRKIEINGITRELVIECFIADAPAKASLLCVKGHSGYGCCTKCNIVGLDKRIHDKVVFPGLDFELRTNESFRARVDERHQNPKKKKSVLEKLEYLDMIKCFPLDYMHVVLLGVVRKIIKLWHEKLPRNILRKIDANISLCKKWFPSEFNRKSRSIFEYGRYKATESRSFLLYLGPVCLRNVLPDSFYRHFMALSNAIRILVSPKYVVEESYLKIAEKLLKFFVVKFPLLYGEDNVTYNVHNLLHLVDDCRQFGTLDSFSAFPYENFLGHIKNNLLRTGVKCLQQVVNRVAEIQHCRRESELLRRTRNLSKTRLVINLSAANCYLLLKDDSVVKLESMNESGKYIGCIGATAPFFIEENRNLTRYDIGFVNFPDATRQILIESDCIKSKLFILPANENETQFVYLPLIHTAL